MTEQPTHSDAALLRAFNSGDLAAMDELVGRYRQALFSWFLGMTGNRADAEDLFQELWRRVIRHAARYHDVSFRAWMWKIARNLVIDYRRRRRPEVSLDETDDDESQPLIDRLPDPQRGPAELIERRDLADRVLRAVARLPDMQREVVLMRIQGELPFHEIARQLDVPLNTALGRMHDALTKIRKLLAEETRS